MPCHMRLLQNYQTLWNIIGYLQFSPRNPGGTVVGQKMRVCFKQARRCDDYSGQDRMRFLACPSSGEIQYSTICIVRYRHQD